MARVTIVPVNITGLSSGSILAGSAVGCDATGTGTGFVSWSSLSSPLGVQWINNGLSFLVVSNGATATAANILAPGVDGSDRHWPVARPAQHGLINAKLRLLVGQAGRIVEQELGAHEADTIGVVRVRVRKIGETLNVDVKLHRFAAPSDWRPRQKDARRRALPSMGFATVFEISDPRG